MAIAPTMAAQPSEPAIIQEVFITVIVDSSAPAWDELSSKYLGSLLRAALQTSNATKIPKRPRISYISYSSASSYASPIIKDMYFTRTQETFNGFSGPLQGPIARNLPDGGSAALEGLVRAVEHFDLMEELEPQSSNSPKHIFFITSSPPDASQRPLWNNCEKFDNFGWKQCQEWLQQRSIALTMVATRLPPNPTYTSLYTSLNPGSIEPIPPTGPVRVFISRALWENMRVPPNQNPSQSAAAAAASQSSPAIATSSPANAASPNASRKRKAPEDAQESPRRAKFPPGTVGNPPVTNTPPPGPAITAGALPPNGSPLRSGSVTGMRPTASVGGAQVKTEPQPTVVPNQAATSIGAQVQNVTQSQQLLRNQNLGTNQPQPGSQALFPPQIAHPYVTASQANSLAGTNNNNHSRLMTATAATAATGPMDGVSFQTNPQVETFISSSQESQRELMMRLKNMMDEHQRVILQLQSENRHLEAKERMAQREKIREFILVLIKTQKARQAQGVGQQNPAMNAASLVTNVAMSVQNPGGPTAGPSRQPFQSGNANNPHEGIQNTLGTNMSANIGNPFNHQLSGSRPPQNPVQPQNMFVWRGSLSITGQDGRRASPDLLVFLNTTKATPQQEHALSAWPGKISMTPIRQNTPPDRLVNWLGQNKPEGLFNVRALELEHWQASQRTPDNAIAIQEGMKNFSMAQTAIITNKLVLHGTINLTTGGTATLILIHAPTGNSGLGLLEPQIAIARYTSPPNLSTLPGVPLPTPASVSNVPAPGTWGVNPLAMAAAQSNTLPTGTNSTPQNIFANGNIGGNNPAVNLGAIAANTTGNSLGNQIGGATGVTSGNNQQQLVNILMNLGGANPLNSVPGANNLDINALLKQPQFIAQLARFKQQQQLHQAQQQHQHQHQMGLAMPASGLMGNSGMGNGGANLTSLGLSGATLLDRMNSQALGRNSMSVAGIAAASALVRQQFLNTLPAHSSAVGAMNANNPTANNASGTAMFNQRNTLGYGLGGGVNMAGGATGAHNRNLNINVGNSGSNGMAVDTDLLRNANLLANQRGISQQDALKALINFGTQQQHGWNGGRAGG